MTLIEALSFIDSEIVTRKSYGQDLANKKYGKSEFVIEQERERLRKFYALRDALRSGLIGELNGQTHKG